MNILFVVSQRGDWCLDITGVDVVPAQIYLTDPAYRNLPATRVFNLCDSYDYQGTGYYVSLLAQARGHDPLPDVKAIEALRSPLLHHMLPPGLSPLMQAAFAEIDPHVDSLAVHSYFGRSVEACFGKLCEALFNWLKIPMVRATFARSQGLWHLQSIAVLPTLAIPPRHVPQVIDAAAECLQAHYHRLREPSARRPSIAILCGNGKSPLPSNQGALRKFVAAADALGMQAELLTRDDIGCLAQFDGLFVRDTTSIDHYTYHLAREAAHAGVVVIDDPDSILKCNNKVFLAELLQQHALPTPKSLHVDRQHLDEVVPMLGLPCVLKQPDGAFSAGVLKAESVVELQACAETLLEHSDWILAQEYLPTDFDWRIGILDRQPIFGCKYYMAHGHWQIIKQGHDNRRLGGATEAVALDEIPAQVLDLAMRAASLIGDGFYGVDLKQVGSRCVIIEINDNPNVDAGNEDAVLQDDLYLRVMKVFRSRIEMRKNHVARRA